MTRTTLEGREEIGSHTYALSNGMQAVRMGLGEWRIFDNAGAQCWDHGDTGVTFKTLRECRQWANERRAA